MSSWVFTVQVIANGENVEQVVINRPLNQLISRTSYLFDQLQRVAGGEMIAALNQTLSSAAIPGTPVYYNEANNRFEPGLLAANEDGDNYGDPKDTSFIAGIVLNKHTTTTGDVCLFGKIDNEIYGIDWSTVSDDQTVLEGQVNLSSTAAGKITKASSSLTARLGTLDANGDLYFQPRTEGSLRDHLHYRFKLTEALVTSVGDAGWLAAADFISNGISVPAGMTHGYNVPVDATLRAAFPPVPRAANAFYIDGLLIPEDAYLLDDTFLWVDNTALATSPWTAETALFLAMLVGDNGNVSSLNPNNDIVPLTITNSGGDAQASGALLLGVNPTDIIGGDTSEGIYALKVASGGKVERGPIVSRLVAGANISLTGEAGDATDGFFGRVLVSSGTDGTAVVQPSIAALDNAVEDFYGEIPSIALPKNRSSSILFAVPMPSNLLANRLVRLSFVFLASVAVSDNMSLEYMRLRPGQSAPTVFTALASVSPAIATGGTPTAVLSEGVAAEPGDILYFRLTQPAPSPSYDLFIPRSLALITAGS